MNDCERKEFGTSLLEIVSSLHTAIERAGGDPNIVASLDTLHTMTVFELMCTLSTNNIRFVHTPINNLNITLEESEVVESRNLLRHGR